jgi:ssDNA-specific exonuclease RecJ
MYFSNSPESLGIFVGDKVDVLFNLDVNEWGGRESTQLIIRDLKPSQLQKTQYKNDMARFEDIRNGASFEECENIMPTRDDFAAVYRLITASVRSGIDTLQHRDIISRLKSSDDRCNIGYIKLKIIIMVFKELNIVAIEDVSDETYKFKIHYSTKKTKLDKSTLLRRLRSQMIRGGR